MLSYQPGTVEALQKANDYGAEAFHKHLTRFGLLCALPTNDVETCLAEVDRGRSDLHADGFAVSAVRKNVMLSDPGLEPVWEKLNSIGAKVWSYPNAKAAPRDDLPSPVIEVAFETCTVIVDMPEAVQALSEHRVHLLALRRRLCLASPAASSYQARKNGCQIQARSPVRTFGSSFRACTSIPRLQQLQDAASGQGVGQGPCDIWC